MNICKTDTFVSSS